MVAPLNLGKASQIKKIALSNQYTAKKENPQLVNKKNKFKSREQNLLDP